MRINIGCGNDLKEGYVNLDFRSPEPSEMKKLRKMIRKDPSTDFMLIDLDKQPLPFPDNSVDYVLAKDILEHFSWRDTEKVLAEWIRVLKPGGILNILVPNFEAHVLLYMAKKTDPRYDGHFGYFQANIFGGQDYIGNYHKALFIPARVRELYDKFNLKMEKFEVAKRYISAEGRK